MTMCDCGWEREIDNNEFVIYRYGVDSIKIYKDTGKFDIYAHQINKKELKTLFEEIQTYLGMEADKQFEKLGYKFDENKKGLSYSYIVNGNKKKDKFEIKIIEIYKENKQWVYCKLEDYNVVGITPEEDKAIHKKIEELMGE